jgi:hypothetical protein
MVWIPRPVMSLPLETVSQGASSDDHLLQRVPRVFQSIRLRRRQNSLEVRGSDPPDDGSGDP